MTEKLNMQKGTINWMRVFEKWCNENSLNKNLDMIRPEQWDKVLEQLYASVDGKEIHLNQTTSQVPLEPVIQFTAGVSSSNVYNFYNCIVVMNQGHTGQANNASFTKRNFEASFTQEKTAQ